MSLPKLPRGKLLPDGYKAGFRIAWDVDALVLAGYRECKATQPHGWGDFMPWLTTVGHRMFMPPWLWELREGLYALFTGQRERAQLIAFLSRGVAEERARALLAAADLVDDGRLDNGVARATAALVLMGEYEDTEGSEAPVVRKGGR